MYLTIAETQKVFRCSRWTVRRRIDAGEIEAIKDGHHVRIVRESVESYIERQTIKAGDGQ